MSEFLSPDVAADDISLYLSKTVENGSAIVHRDSVKVPKTTQKAKSYSMQLSDMEIVCDGKQCRLVPSDKSISINTKKSTPRKKRKAPLPPIDENKACEFFNEDVQNFPHSSSSTPTNDFQCRLQARESNRHEATTSKKLSVKGMDYVLQNYDVYGDCRSLSCVSEIEYMLQPPII
ncbi:hypothetical protein EB796_021436 [Bugula neritina]|uniref:Uncharacterized protein n=1 Tax=Bugula neritina TaxID=10212 RepID=A0A7J7J3I6_BUGNE|nr:hypothetical protein EB796_021436 [Bugula neritina]